MPEPDSSSTASHKPAQKLNVRYIFFLMVWVMLAMTFSQYAIGLPMRALLGNQFNQPFYTCIFYGLTYILALVLIIFASPKIPKIAAWFNQRAAHSASNPRSSRKKTLPELKTSRAELGLTGLPSVVDVLLAPIAYFAYLILAQIFTNIMSLFSWFDAKQTQDVGFGYFITTNDRVIAMIALVFIAPIAEEIVMRGWLYGKMREKLKVPLAMLLTSLVFSVLHGQWNVGVGVFALSLALCGLREITGTIWSGILLHMLSNGVAFYLLFIAM